MLLCLGMTEDKTLKANKKNNKNNNNNNNNKNNKNNNNDNNNNFTKKDSMRYTKLQKDVCHNLWRAQTALIHYTTGPAE